MNTIEKLDALAELQAQQTLVEMDYNDKKKMIQAQIQEELDALDAEYNPIKSSLQEKSTALESEIKQDVLLNGATVKGSHIQAVYTKGRVTWDSKQLDGLMMVVPQLAQARKEGDPSVSLRKI